MIKSGGCYGRAAALAAALLLCSSCTKPEPVAFGNLCAAAMDKKVVVTEGYLRVGASVFCSNIGGGDVTCGLDMFGPQGGETKIGAHVPEGSGGSEFEKPERGYKKEDLKLHADDGSLVGPQDRVRVTGKMSFAEGSGTRVCFINVSKIERL